MNIKNDSDKIFDIAFKLVQYDELSGKISSLTSLKNNIKNKHHLWDKIKSEKNYNEFLKQLDEMYESYEIIEKDLEELNELIVKDFLIKTLENFVPVEVYSTNEINKEYINEINSLIKNSPEYVNITYESFDLEKQEILNGSLEGLQSILRNKEKVNNQNVNNLITNNVLKEFLEEIKQTKSFFENEDSYINRSKKKGKERSKELIEYFHILINSFEALRSKKNLITDFENELDQLKNEIYVKNFNIMLSRELRSFLNELEKNDNNFFENMILNLNKSQLKKCLDTLELPERFLLILSLDSSIFDHVGNLLSTEYLEIAQKSYNLDYVSKNVYLDLIDELLCQFISKI